MFRVIFLWSQTGSTSVIIFAHGIPRLHGARMTLQKLIKNIRLLHIHHNHLVSHALTIIFFQIFGVFLCQKIYRSKGKLKTAFIDLLASKPLGFYRSGINNFVNQLRKGIMLYNDFWYGFWVRSWWPRMLWQAVTLWLVNREMAVHRGMKTTRSD